MTGKRALVLGGGGVAGIAWETGILIGIADESPAAAAALSIAYSPDTLYAKTGSVVCSRTARITSR